MKLILYITVFSIFLCKIECGKLKICLPKKKITSEGDTSKIEIPDEIRIPLQDFPININYETYNGTVLLTNLILKDYKDFSICCFSKLNVPLTITLKNLYLGAEHYVLNGNIAGFFIMVGDGSFNIIMEDLIISITDFSLNPFTKCITFDIDLELQNLKSNFTNLMNGDEFLNPMFNTIIGQIGPDFFKHYWPNIYKELENPLQKLLDFIMGKIELSNIEGSIPDICGGNKLCKNNQHN